MTAKKKAYVKRDKKYWKNPSARRRRPVAAGVAQGNTLECDFCPSPARARLATLGRKKAFLLCDKDLRRLVNGKSML
jgi:hypothetical protein